MNPWTSYDARAAIRGVNNRDATLRREITYLKRTIPGSLSYHHLKIDGEEREMAVINSDNLNIKTLCTLPGEDLPYGGLVDWMGEHWLITARDANNELYTKATMTQCNYLLRWVAEDNTIQERWCIIEDGTKYLVGEVGDNSYVLEKGDSRISITIAKDKYTARFNRESRFLVDDYDSPTVLAYRMTKPFKLSGTYNGKGVFAFVLQECNTEESDNLELHIANYYDHFPRKPKRGVMPDDTSPEDDLPDENLSEPEPPDRKRWL